MLLPRGSRYSYSLLPSLYSLKIYLFRFSISLLRFLKPWRV